MIFEFATAGRIIFGPRTLSQAAPEAAALGSHVLLVTGRNPQRAEPLRAALAEAGMTVETFAAGGEPTVDMACAASDAAREASCDIVIAYGGGSVIDLAKAAAALITNTGHPLDYLEVIGKGQPLTEPPAPCIAIPTTAGTGSEVTKNAVLASPEHQVKVSMRHASMIPNIAIVDPECTHSMPPDVTAATGLDALTQLLEAFISKKATPMTDAVCREGLPRAVGSLRRVVEDGSDAEAREQMAFASLCGGLALANAGLGAVHGFAGPLGGMFAAPHGSVCASLLPHTMRVNLAALRSRAPELPALERLAEFGRMAGCDSADDAIDWLSTLCRDLRVPTLDTLGVTEADLPVLVEKGRASSSMKGNPIELDDEELHDLLHAALVGNG